MAHETLLPEIVDSMQALSEKIESSLLLELKSDMDIAKKEKDELRRQYIDEICEWNKAARQNEKDLDEKYEGKREPSWYAERYEWRANNPKPESYTRYKELDATILTLTKRIASFKSLRDILNNKIEEIS